MSLTSSAAYLRRLNFMIRFNICAVCDKEEDRPLATLGDTQPLAWHHVISTWVVAMSMSFTVKGFKIRSFACVSSTIFFHIYDVLLRLKSDRHASIFRMWMFMTVERQACMARHGTVHKAYWLCWRRVTWRRRSQVGDFWRRTTMSPFNSESTCCGSCAVWFGASCLQAGRKS